MWDPPLTSSNQQFGSIFSIDMGFLGDAKDHVRVIRGMTVQALF